MDVPPFVTTARLLLTPLTVADAPFILELVNTEGWLQFIGNRNITSPPEATAYIQKILANPNISYWVVQRKDNQQPIGIVTFIKREYLEHLDIGFAFLPNVAKHGYAYEATSAVLHKLISERHLSHILATTVPENTNSIKLLKKIGLVFEKEMGVGTEKIHVYVASTDALLI